MTGSRDRGAEHGSVLVLLPGMLVLAVLVVVVIVDLGGHLIAVSRATAIADAAALAAVSTPASDRATTPRGAAAEVVAAGGGRLEVCRCVPGTRRAHVRVSVEVVGIAWPRLGAARQFADADAALEPDP